MTSRERLLNTLAYAPVDRVPLWEEGVRDDVRAAWDAQGLAGSADLARLFSYDRREELSVNIGPVPAFGDASAEPEVFVRLRDHYHPSPSRFPANWTETRRRLARRSHPLGMTVWRGILQSLAVGEWRSLERLLLALNDVPSVIARTLSGIADCAMRTVEHALNGVTLDYAVFDEPIAGAYGSVMSPQMFRRFCYSIYRDMVDMLRARGVRWFVVRTYGNPTALLPVWLESGINVLWCFEGAVGGVDYCALRKRHGRHLRLIGGIDLRAIEAGPSAIEAALLRTVPGLLEDGGYVPMSDGRVRANMPWAHYRYYRTRLQQIATFHSDQGGMP